MTSGGNFSQLEWSPVQRQEEIDMGAIFCLLDRLSRPTDSSGLPRPHRAVTHDSRDHIVLPHDLPKPHHAAT